MTENNFVLNYTLSDVRENPYIYKVVEKNTGLVGYQYSAAEYEVRVTVSDNESGSLSVNARYKQTSDDNGVEKDSKEFNTVDDSTKLTFKNTYRAKGSVDLKGKKILKNAETQKELTVPNGEFEFELYEISDYNPEISDSGTENFIASVKNQKDGSFQFFGNDIEKLQYDESGIGTHYYAIREVKGDKGYYTYFE